MGPVPMDSVAQVSFLALGCLLGHIRTPSVSSLLLWALVSSGDMVLSVSRVVLQPPSTGTMGPNWG